jgi:pre-rRNA-processing protein TSR3
MSFEVRILCFDQDDPKKCTAKRLEKFGLSRNYSKIRDLPPRGIVLDPFSDKVLSSEDSILGQVGGLVGVDCSWNLAAKTFAKLRVMGLEPRKLPDIVPANPVNSGKIGKLTTAEALAGALMICNQTETAESLMAVFKWGPAFLQLNSIFWK